MMPASCWSVVCCCAEWGSYDALSAQQRQRLHQHSPFLRLQLRTAGMHLTALTGVPQGTAL